LLTDFEVIKDPYDWDVGIHGIEIEFKSKGRTYRGTYLPNVASEQGWNQQESINHLV